MMKFFWMFTSEIKYGLIIQRRYVFDIVASIINTLLFMVFIQIGIHSFQGNVASVIVGQKLSSLIIGFFTFMTISSGITTLSNNIMEGAATGTLEQTMLTPLGAKYIFLSRAMVSSSINFIICLSLLPLTMLICRHWFSLDVVMLIVLALPLLLCCWGIGFIIGALALIFKKVQGFMNLIQFLILFLIIVPSYPFTLYSLLPAAPQAMTMNRVLALGQEVSWGWMIFLYFHGFACLLIGKFIFHIGEIYARKKGILGQY